MGIERGKGGRTIRLYPQIHPGLAGVRNAVAAELDVWVLHDNVAQGVAERVVFVVELEAGGVVGGAWELVCKRPS